MTVYATFTPPGVVNISPGSSLQYKPRVNQAPFGDGYGQRSGDGLNANPARCNAAFRVLKKSEADSICDFFAARKGYIPFMWTPPNEATAKQWIAVEWEKTYVESTAIYDVTATFEQTFNP